MSGNILKIFISGSFFLSQLWPSAIWVDLVLNVTVMSNPYIIKLALKIARP